MFPCERQRGQARPLIKNKIRVRTGEGTSRYKGQQTTSFDPFSIQETQEAYMTKKKKKKEKKKEKKRKRKKKERKKYFI